MHFHSIALLGCLIATSLAVPLPESDNTSNAKSIKDTCTNLKLAKDGHTLTASCKSLGGSSKESSIDLNNFIGNDNGNYKWASTDFILSTTEILDLEDGTILQGYLKDAEDEEEYATLDLAENIKNVDGTLTYTGPTPPPRS